MRIDRIVPNLTVDDLGVAAGFHQQVLGMDLLVDHGWIMTLGAPDGRQLGLISDDASAPVNPDVSVFVDDVHEAFDRARAAGAEIVHPLTEEPWGVTRFLYRDAWGNVVNVGMHTRSGA